ncbi:helix-turn-helix transcriptional regulator [Actinokineospora sp. NBRC 105648]|uniref:helix-turn-helix domain-containing protein n=1 Tax=Actinokineospora sp. NBRC 105648 TaxID=3032206 RepID=UPI0024A49FB3|nr:helix-turn-helix transcriptional regulator [Actinokineospora sp. NBRC 105648]GLZ39846.1 hypothetical protein Acsp05_34700 [Actinokineospora sp. NBRC 105648]
MSNDDPSARAELAEWMDSRRVDLDLSWQEVAERAGMSAVNLRRVRRGTISLPRRTKRRLERALLVAEGGVDEVLAGGQAAKLDTAEPAPRPAALPGSTHQDVEAAVREHFRVLRRSLPRAEFFRVVAEELALMHAEHDEPGETG